MVGITFDDLREAVSTGSHSLLLFKGPAIVYIDPPPNLSPAANGLPALLQLRSLILD